MIEVAYLVQTFTNRSRNAVEDWKIIPLWIIEVQYIEGRPDE